MISRKNSESNKNSLLKLFFIKSDSKILDILNLLYKGMSLINNVLKFELFLKAVVNLMDLILAPLFSKKSSKKFAAKSKRLFFKPKPRLEFVSNSINQITSSIDSSDGLSSCLNELANQSKKKFLITKLPTNDDIREFSLRNKIDLKKLVLDGGFMLSE